MLTPNVPYPFFVGRAFGEMIGRVLGAPAMAPFEAHELLRRAMNEDPTCEVLTRMHKPRRREVARALNELLGAQQLDDGHILSAIQRAAYFWREQQQELNDPRRQRVKAHIENGTLVAVIRGEDCVYVTPPEMPGVARPTDHHELLQRAIFPACEALAPAFVAKQLGLALREACSDVLGTFCALQCLHFLNCSRDREGNLPIPLDCGGLLPFLASRWLAVRHEFDEVDSLMHNEPGASWRIAHAWLTNVKYGAPRPDLMSKPDVKTRAGVWARIIEGDLALRNGDSTAAYMSYRSALDAVPEPRDTHGETVWLLAALGDLFLRIFDFGQARKAFRQALQCNREPMCAPQLHLRLGQAECELGDYAAAAQSLWTAYQGAGKDLFATEPPKYLRFLEARTTGLTRPPQTQCVLPADRRAG